MINKLMKILFVFLAFFVLSACDPAEDEAKKLGFNDVQDMRSIQVQGWHTKEKYYEDTYVTRGFNSIAAARKSDDEFYAKSMERVKTADHTNTSDITKSVAE